MNILFLTRFYNPHIGGVETHVERVSERLINRGYKVTVITTKFRKDLPSQENLNRVSVKRFFQPKVKYVGLLYTWLWLIKNIGLIKKSDIVHCHDVFIWYLPFKFLLPRKKVFTTFHGWEGVYPIGQKNILLKKMALRFSDGNIIMGEYLEKHYGIKGDVVSYGAVDLPKKFLKKKKRLIVYLGRLDDDTGLTVFLKTFPKLRGFQVEFCGDGPLRGECEKYGYVHGFIDPKDFLTKATFCLAGGFLSTLQALANKCFTFVAYNNPLRHDAFGLAPFSQWITLSNSSKEISEKIKYYSREANETQIMLNKGYDWVKRESWKNLVRSYLKIWRLGFPKKLYRK